MVWLSGVAGGQVLKTFILQAFGKGTVDSGSTSGGSSPPPPAENKSSVPIQVQPSQLKFFATNPQCNLAFYQV